MSDEGDNSSASDVYSPSSLGTVRDEDHPLCILLSTRPHSMEIKIKPWNIRNHTVIRSVPSLCLF